MKEAHFLKHIVYEMIVSVLHFVSSVSLLYKHQLLVVAKLGNKRLYLKMKKKLKFMSAMDLQ